MPSFSVFFVVFFSSPPFSLTFTLALPSPMKRPKTPMHKFGLLCECAPLHTREEVKQHMINPKMLCETPPISPLTVYYNKKKDINVYMRKVQRRLMDHPRDFPAHLLRNAAAEHCERELCAAKCRSKMKSMMTVMLNDADVKNDRKPENKMRAQMRGRRLLNA